MENFSSQWLATFRLERYAPLLSSYGYSTFAKCSQLTEEELTRAGVTDDTDREKILGWVRKLQGKQEADIIRDIPVSVLHTDSVIHHLVQCTLVLEAIPNNGIGTAISAYSELDLLLCYSWCSQHTRWYITITWYISSE